MLLSPTPPPLGWNSAQTGSWEEALSHLPETTWHQKKMLLDEGVRQGSVAVVRTLMAAGAHPFAGCGPEGKTSLIDAVTMCRVDLVEALSDPQAPCWHHASTDFGPSQRWLYFRSALQDAIEVDDVDILRVLTANPMLRDYVAERTWGSKGQSPVSLAIEHGAAKSLKWALVQYPPTKPWEACHVHALPWMLTKDLDDHAQARYPGTRPRV